MARTCDIVEPAGDEPKLAQPEKNDERDEGSVIPKTGNQINAPFMGTRSRTRVDPELSQPLQAPESQGHKRRANTNDMSIVCVKPESPWVLWYNVTSVKIGFTPSVLVGETRRSGSWQRK